MALGSIGGAIGMGALSAGLGLLGGRAEGRGLKRAQRRGMMAADPFMAHRPEFADELAELMRDPTTVRDLPGYDFRMREGERALSRGLGAQGHRLGGRRMAGLMRYGQEFATDEFDRQFQRLSQLALGSPQAAGQVGATLGTERARAASSPFDALGYGFRYGLGQYRLGQTLGG